MTVLQVAGPVERAQRRDVDAVPGALTVELDGRGTPVCVVGGKAAALDRLVACGVPVPPAAALTVTAYRVITSAPELSDLIAELIAAERAESADGDPDTAARRVADPDEIDAAFLRARMRDDLADEVLRVVRSVRARAASGLLVIRSSATVEDTGTASFAGQYRSVLDVGDDDAALRAVRLVWASLWHDAPREYRRTQGIDPGRAAMAVIVMAQVEARCSGVVFTQDPGGSTDTARVEMVSGLADALVGGRVTPAAHPVAPDGTAAGAPAEALQAVAMARHVADVLGAPQDVEWACDGDDILVVQSRPITVAPAPADPFDTAVDPTALYTTSGIGEALPGVLAPLTWSIVGPAQEEGIRELFVTAGGDVGGLAGELALLGRQRGRAVLDFDRVRAVAASIPGVAVDELEQQYVGVAADGLDRAVAPPGTNRSRRRGARRRQRGDAGRARRHAATDASVVATAVDLVLDANVGLAALGDGELVGYHDRLVDLGRRAIAGETIVAASAAGVYRRLELLLESWFDAAEARRWAVRVCAPSGRAANVNGVDVTSPELARRAGARAVFGGPTWEEIDPAELSLLVGEGGERGEAGEAGQPGQAGQAAAELELTLRERRGWTTTRVLTGQVVDVRIHLLRRTTADARTWLARRDDTKDAVLRLGGELRRVHLEVGRRLVSQGLLSSAADVELLSAHELVAAAVGGTGPTAAELSRRRRQLRGHGTTELPVQFVGRAPIADLAAATADDRLVGWSASAGRARGRPCIVRDPLDHRLVDGGVLVATTTDASWLPLFLRAAAVVVERGGPLSHAAICARELGLPAVVNVPGAVERLEGETADVVVDGDAGTVTVVRAAPIADDDAPAAVPVAGAVAAGEPAANALLETFDELDEPALHVFVPAIMTLGLLASIGSLLVDAFRSLTRGVGWRRCIRVLGRLTATATAAGEDAARRDHAGLRRRGTYAATAIASIALSAYVVIGQTGNYLRQSGYLSNIAWLWVAGLLVGAVFLWIGAQCTQIAARYDRPPPRARAMLMHTPLSRSPDDAEGRRRRARR